MSLVEPPRVELDGMGCGYPREKPGELGLAAMPMFCAEVSEDDTEESAAPDWRISCVPLRTAEGRTWTPEG